MNLGIVTAIATPLGVILTAVITIFFNRRKEAATTSLDTAQAAKVIQGAALEMLQPLRERINRLEKHVSALENKVHDLETELESERDKRISAETERDQLKAINNWSNNV